MKRCPECGFRAKDKICPLCGCRMRDLPGAARELQTHTHKQMGERCVLPHQELPKRPVNTQGSYTPPKQQQKKQQTSKSQLPSGIVPILIFVLFVILRSCSG